ncbi:MAG: diacylglycerol kinase [Candidatus Andersenbacteria bacterium]
MSHKSHAAAHKGGSFPAAVRYASRGVRLAWRDEKNLRRHAWLFPAALLVGWFVQLSAVEWVMIIVVAGLVVASEIGNSALEALADAVHPSFNPGIERAKDMAAASVLVTCVIASVVGVILLVWPLVRLLVAQPLL